MKKLLLLFLVTIPSYAIACMPPFPWEVMIGRISSLSQTQTGQVDIVFSSYNFPFRDYAYPNPTSWHWQSYSNTRYPSSITAGSLAITLSDYQDGSYPTSYSVFHITTLTCKNGIIQLWKKYGSITGWDRKLGKCWYGAKSLLDVFIDGNESAWIKKLQEKYPTCDQLQHAFPIKQEKPSRTIKTLYSQDDLSDEILRQSSWIDWILFRIDDFFHFV